MEAAANAATYIGSPEHKDTPSFAGQPRPRADASICDRTLGQNLVEGWLKDALRKGSISSFREGRFPRYVWFKDGDQVYEGRLVNRELGEYKGYPLSRDEWPQGIEEIYE